MINKADIKINTDFKVLETLEKKLSGGEKYITKVGVLGGNYDDGQTIAQIGFTQEVGSVVRKIHARSFLKEPLMNHLKERVINNKTLKESILNEKEPLKQAYEYLGVIGQVISQESFDNKGDGTWAPNAPATVAKKGVNNPLIDTGRLRRSITYKVEEEK